MSQSNLVTRDSDHATERAVPVTRIRIDDLPIAEELTPEQEALIQGAGLKSFRPQLEVLEGRALPSGMTPLVNNPSVIEVPVMVTNIKVIANQVQLNPIDIKSQLDKGLPPATQPGAASPFAGVPAGSIRTLELEAGKGFVAKTAPAPVQRVEDGPIEQIKGVTAALLAQAESYGQSALAQAKSYGQSAWRWLVLKAAGKMIRENPNIPTLKLVGAE